MQVSGLELGGGWWSMNHFSVLGTPSPNGNLLPLCDPGIMNLDNCILMVIQPVNINKYLF